jgi:hypothetical protein
MMSGGVPARVSPGGPRTIGTEEDPEMVFMDEGFERAMDAVGRVARIAMVPLGGAEACVDANEAAIRATTDAQRDVARVISVEPVRWFVASCADLTRDIGAAHLSGVRWILDV